MSKGTHHLIALVVAVALGGLGVGSAEPADEGTVWPETTKLLAHDGAANGLFGRALSFSKDTILVGELWDDDNGERSGSAYVFVRQGGVWSLQGKLLPSDGTVEDEFGFAVALSGDTALVGARLDDDNGDRSGSAYVFVRQGGVWSQQAKLLPGDGEVDDQFGVAVALSEDIALVGAPLDDDNGNLSGSVYVFMRQGEVWTQQAKLMPNDGAIEDRFGISISLSDGRALIGAFRADGNSEDSGAAYVFVRRDSVWVQQDRLVAADGEHLDYFGLSVSLSGDTALVGAALDGDNGVSSGSAYVFVHRLGDWVQRAKLLPSDGAETDWFGVSVSLSRNTALVGAYHDDDNGLDSGSAYIFVRRGHLWTQETKLLASDGTDTDSFGLRVSLSGDTAVVGAHRHGDKGNTSGSAYIFSSPLFFDGFESGDTSAWSTTVP